MPSAEEVLIRAKEYAACFGALTNVDAVVLGGSGGSGSFSQNSDIDLYVYSAERPSIDFREQLAKKFSDYSEIDNVFWEPGDEWFDLDLRIGVDVMYRTPEWIQNQLDHVLQKHKASLGYTTCFWHNVLNSTVLFDRNGWFRELQKRVTVAYPVELSRAIVTKNYPVLRKNQSSYRNQIAKAITREDLISINHRIAAFLASYFDIIFAINRIPHPGEKRLFNFAPDTCSLLPKNFPEVTQVIRMIPTCDQQILDSIDLLCDGMDEFVTNH